MAKLSLINEKLIINGIKNNQPLMIMYAYKKYYPTIANFIRLNGGNDHDAKDIFQESMLVLYHNLQKKDFELTCQLNTYLYSIARNLWLRELKKNNKNYQNIEDYEDFLDDNDIDKNNFEDIEESLRNQRILSQSLEKLGDPCKTILTLFYIDQMSMKDIADKMGYTNAKNAKNQKYKCLLRLKKIFNKQIDYESH